jgi:hypothetical protein
MPTAPVSEIEERLESLEGKIEALGESLRRLERRVGAIEAPGLPAGEEPPPVEEPLPAPALPPQGDVLNVLTEVGRSCLVLGGAFLVRAITDSGMLARPVGAALGLAYAVLWIFLADRAAARGRSTSAAFLGFTAAVIAYPLVVETSTRMAVFGPSAAAAILAVLTALCLGVAWRRGLGVFAWTALAAAVASCFVLALVRASVEPFAAALLAIGLVTLWLAYSSRPWRGLRWPAAAAADLMVIWAALQLASSEPGSPRSISSFLLLAFALPFLYLGSFAVRTLARRRNVVLFDVVQGIAALAVGFGGAAFVVRHVKDAQPTLGASAVLIAAGCYGVAFVFVERREEQRNNFLFYATLALLLTLSGTALMTRGPLLVGSWCVLALAAAGLGMRFRRETLAFHSAVYAGGAAWQAGALASSLDSFTAAASQPWSPLTVPGGLAIGVCAAVYGLLARKTAETGRLTGRIARIALAVLVAFGAGGFAVAVLRNLLAGADPGATAAVRTAVLAGAALLLAAIGRRAGLAELSWLAYAVLILGGVKLLLEDLPGGRPATLFFAFAFYGTALILAPRLLRKAPAGRISP